MPYSYFFNEKYSYFAHLSAFFKVSLRNQIQSTRDYTCIDGSLVFRNIIPILLVSYQLVAHEHKVSLTWAYRIS